MIKTNFSNEELKMLYESVKTESSVRNLSWQVSSDASQHLELLIKLWKLIDDETVAHPYDFWI